MSGENVLKIIAKGASDAFGASLAYFTLYSQPIPVTQPIVDSTRNRFSSLDTFSTIVERKGIPDV